MKFNFEKFTKNSKEKIKTYTLPVLTLLAIGSLKNKENANQINIIDKSSSSKEIYMDAPTREKNNQYRYFPNVELDGNISQEDSVKIDSDEEILKEEINKLQKEIGKLSNLKPEIKEGVFSIISRSELAQKKSPTFRTENGLEVTSPLDIKYISDLVTFNLINETPGVNFATTDVEALNSEKELENEGYLPAIDSKFYIPEYYFVLNKEVKDGEINIQCQIFASKDSKIVHTINIKEKLPEGDEFLDDAFKDFVDKKLVPVITNTLKEKIINSSNK